VAGRQLKMEKVGSRRESAAVLAEERGLGNKGEEESRSFLSGRGRGKG